MANKDLTGLLDDFNDQDTDEMLSSILGSDESDNKPVKPKQKKSQSKRKDIKIPKAFSDFDSLEDTEKLLEETIAKAEKRQSKNSLKFALPKNEDFEIPEDQKDLLRQQTIAYRSGNLKKFESNLSKEQLTESRSLTRLKDLPVLKTSLKSIPKIKKQKKLSPEIKEALPPETEKIKPDLEMPKLKSGLKPIKKSDSKDQKFDLSILDFEQDFLVSTKGLINKDQLLEILNDTYFQFLEEHEKFDLFNPPKNSMKDSALSILQFLLKPFIKLLKPLIKAPLKFLGKLFKGGLDFFKKSFAKVWKPIQAFLNKVKGFVSKSIQFLKDLASKLMGKISNLFKSIGNKISRIFKGIGNKIGSFFKSIGTKVGNIFSKFKGTFGKLSSKFHGFFDVFRRSFERANKAWSKVKGLIKKAGDALPKAANALKKTGGKLAEKGKSLAKITGRGLKKVPGLAKAGGKAGVKLAGKALGKALPVVAAVDIAAEAGGVAKDIYQKGLFETGDALEREAMEASVGENLLGIFTSPMKMAYHIEALTNKALKKLQPETWIDKMKNKLQDIKESVICEECPIRLRMLELQKQNSEESEVNVIRYPNDGTTVPFSNFQQVGG